MKKLVVILMAFMASCKCENDELMLNGVLLSKVDSLPVTDYSLGLDYAQRVKGELGCGLNFRFISIRTNTSGGFMYNLKVAKNAHTVKITGKNQEVIYDSVISNNLKLYVMP